MHVACTGLVYEKDIFMRRKFSLLLGGPRPKYKRGKIMKKKKFILCFTLVSIKVNCEIDMLKL